MAGGTPGLQINVPLWRNDRNNCWLVKKKKIDRERGRVLERNHEERGNYTECYLCRFWVIRPTLWSKAGVNPDADFNGVYFSSNNASCFITEGNMVNQFKLSDAFRVLVSIAMTGLPLDTWARETLEKERKKKKTGFHKVSTSALIQLSFQSPGFMPVQFTFGPNWNVLLWSVKLHRIPVIEIWIICCCSVTIKTLSTQTTP